MYESILAMPFKVTVYEETEYGKEELFFDMAETMEEAREHAKVDIMEEASEGTREADIESREGRIFKVHDKGNRRFLYAEIEKQEEE